jgi:hypothetical protein
VRRLASTLGAIALLASVPAPATAVTRLEGEYQLMLDLRKDQRFFPWDFDSNSNDNYDGAQLRLFSTPRRNTEAFVKVEADWRNPENNTPRPVVQFREAHLRYAWDVRPQQGVESYLFFRQDRYWADSYLIRLVNTGIAKNDRWGANGSGIRVNTWGLLGGQSSFIVSDFADQYSPESGTGNPTNTDDAYIARLRRDFLRDRSLRLGFGFNRRVEDQVNEFAEEASTYAFDSRYQWRGIDWSLEYAFTRSPISSALSAFPNDWTGVISERSTAVAEIRTLRLGNPRTGYFNFVPAGWLRGPLYDNRLDDSGRDEVGSNLNAYYLLPERAVTLTGNWRQFYRTTIEKKREREGYIEAYIEFVNGFTGKTYYRSLDIERDVSGRRFLEQHDDLFGEVQVESRLAWLRVQAKLKDMGADSQKELFNLDTALNITERLKIYNRFSFGSDPAILRKGIFTQLQYRPTGNVEMFLEYGPNWIGDDSTPVNDGDLEGGGDQADLLKFILRGQF